MPRKKFIVTARGLNQRTGPGTDYRVVSVLPYGTVLEDLTHPDWCPTPGGWVHRGYLAPYEAPVEPAWLVIARRELGVKEVYGGQHNKRIVEYHQTTTLKATDDETPWCSSFVNWCITQAGIKGTNSAAAISWASWGKSIPLDQAQPGDIAVFTRSGGNHAGFYISHDANAVRVLGGNQSDEVNIATFSRARLLTIRRPV